MILAKMNLIQMTYLPLNYDINCGISVLCKFFDVQFARTYSSAYVEAIFIILLFFAILLILINLSSK